MDRIEMDIADIRYFQRYEMHEEALNVASKIPIEKLDIDKAVKVCKLISFSYRKLEDQNKALLYINKAITIVKNEIQKDENNRYIRELGICLMNKGVIYDSLCDYSTACSIYLKALSIFRSVEGIEDGLMINALINYGDALFNCGKIQKSCLIYSEALFLLNDKSDKRYEYIKGMLDVISKKNDIEAL